MEAKADTYASVALDGIVIIASHPLAKSSAGVSRAGWLRAVTAVSRGSRDTFFVIDAVAQILVQL